MNKTQKRWALIKSTMLLKETSSFLSIRDEVISSNNLNTFKIKNSIFRKSLLKLSLKSYLKDSLLKPSLLIENVTRGPILLDKSAVLKISSDIIGIIFEKKFFTNNQAKYLETRMIGPRCNVGLISVINQNNTKVISSLKHPSIKLITLLNHITHDNNKSSC